jgi:hypothetical protein
MKMIAINKHSSKMKNRSVEMPNAPYLNRSMLFKENKYGMKILILIKRKITSFAILIFALILTGCAAIGTKTIYKTTNLNNYDFNNIGYSQPASDNVLNKIRPNTSKIFYSAFIEFFTAKTLKIEKYELTDFKTITEIDTSKIRKICTENDLDGYICTQIKYKFVNNYYMYIPIGKSEDAYVEMKLYDKKGILIIHTKHNTYAGNSYMMPPKAEQTIRDGTIGALKRILKEVEKSNNLGMN